MDQSPPGGAEGAAVVGTSLFIVNSSRGTINAEARKAIRSHVMRGKNKGKQLRKPRSSTEPRKEVRNVEYSAWFLSSPRAVATELSLFGYREDMKPYMLNLVYQAFTVVKPSMYTAEMALVDGSEFKMFCYSDIPQNPALLHTLLFTSQAFIDISQRLPLGAIAQRHLSIALQNLQWALNDEKMATSNATLIAVTSLATAAAILGDVETAQKHLDGLNKMIQLRGGFQTLEKGGLIEHKAQRVDIGVAMATGAPLRFFDKDNISWGTQLAHGIDINRLPEVSSLSPRPDPRLLNIWADLRVFARAANEATQTGIKMPQAFFTKMTSTVPARLISLRGHYDATSLSELLRLCMMAFLKSVLVQLDGLGAQMRALGDGLRVALEALAGQILTHSCGLEKFFFWALFMSTLTIFEGLHGHDWLRTDLLRSTSGLGLRNWAETRSTLKSFLWIDMLYNKPGKLLVEDLRSFSQSEELKNYC